jgi:D-alanyl-D-alanine carboxypeptidase
MRRAVVLFVLLVLALPAAADPSHGAGERAAGLRAELQSFLARRGAVEHVSALSLAVSFAPEEPALLVTAGTSAYGAGQPISDTSLFQIGSNTKAFTAVAILQLEAQGRLSIDAPLGTDLPQYPAYARLTLRRLLNMTAGLESYDNLPVWESRYAAAPKARVAADTLIRYVYPQQKYPPGSRYAYSNTGYLLAQEVVAARSASRSYAAEVDRIIASVGLKYTYYTSHLYPPAIASGMTAGYYENDDAGLRSLVGRDVSRDSLSWAQGAGAIISTPGDLVTWVRALYSGNRLLPPKQHDELLQLVSTKTARPIAHATANDPAGFGLGVAQRYDPKLGAFWFYQGETLGFRAAHVYFPRSGLVVALFANSRPIEKESGMQELFERIDARLKR